MKAKPLLYVIQSGNRPLYKLSLTSRHISFRLTSLQIGNPDKLKCICYFKLNKASQEKTIHRIFADDHVRGEWFDLRNLEKALCHIEEYLNSKRIMYECDPGTPTNAIPKHIKHELIDGRLHLKYNDVNESIPY